MNLLSNLITVQNTQDKYTEASHNILVYQTLAPKDACEHPEVYLQAAIAADGCGKMIEASNMFQISIVSFSASAGLWHAHCLRAMKILGTWLARRGHVKASLVFLRECCLGYGYLLGVDHENYTETRHQLDELSCTLADDQLEHKWMHCEHLPRALRKRLASRAYKSIFLNTSFDLLETATKLMEGERLTMELKYYAKLYSRLGSALETTQPDLTRSRLRRLLRICEGKIGLPPIHAVDKEAEDYRSQAALLTLGIILDEIKRCNADSSKLRQSVSILRIMGVDKDLTKGERRAIHQTLVEQEVTHFPVEYTEEMSSLVLQMDREVLARGTFAEVDTISIGMRKFARKSFRLPRYNQQSIRNMIDNEVSVLRKLDHPHIVQVYVTYEETHSFHIVMDPLADYDLEAFLARDPSLVSIDRREKLVRRWLGCLANTLAFIHAQGVRHKDLKPRNILVRKDKIVFADFGSSLDFLDEGSSTTEGPASGHTKMYCAPEVISGRRRNRSADIFSLGCIFTDLLAWHGGDSIYNWNEKRRKLVQGVSTIAYHATIDEVIEFFRGKVSDSRPGSQRDNIPWSLLFTLVAGMLNAESERRPSAVRTSQALKDVMSGHHCSKCDLEFWMVD